MTLILSFSISNGSKEIEYCFLMLILMLMKLEVVLVTRRHRFPPMVLGTVMCYRHVHARSFHFTFMPYQGRVAKLSFHHVCLYVLVISQVSLLTDHRKYPLSKLTNL